jgi:putative molybdopterin biosynthesis protein
MAVKNRIQQLRKTSSLTQSFLAEAAGISRQAYMAIETGKSVPSTEVALRLARLLKTTVEELFWLDDTDIPEKIVQADLIDDTGIIPGDTRMQLTQVGSRLIARPMKGGMSVSHIFNQADALSIEETAQNTVNLKLINRSAEKIPTLLLAGCDPSTSILAAMIRDMGVRLVWIESESMPALHALARGEIHIAGCNFKDRISGIYNTPLVKEIVPFPCTIIRFALWRQGMIITAGNPKSIRVVDDLTRPDVTFINRHPGAGSRGLLNRLLWESKITPGDIHGYDRTVNGHLAAAEMIAAGLADCGIGIEAAARASELDFLALIEEPYDLVIPDHFMELPAVRSLLELLKSRNLHYQIESLGGYDTSPMGISYS